MSEQWSHLEPRATCLGRPFCVRCCGGRSVTFSAASVSSRLLSDGLDHTILVLKHGLGFVLVSVGDVSVERWFARGWFGVCRCD